MSSTVGRSSPASSRFRTFRGVSGIQSLGCYEFRFHRTWRDYASESCGNPNRPRRVRSRRNVTEDRIASVRSCVAGSAVGGVSRGDPAGLSKGGLRRAVGARSPEGRLQYRVYSDHCVEIPGAAIDSLAAMAIKYAMYLVVASSSATAARSIARRFLSAPTVGLSASTERSCRQQSNG